MVLLELPTEPGVAVDQREGADGVGSVVGLQRSEPRHTCCGREPSGAAGALMFSRSATHTGCDPMP